MAIICNTRWSPWELRGENSQWRHGEVSSHDKSQSVNWVMNSSFKADLGAFVFFICRHQSNDLRTSHWGLRELTWTLNLNCFLLRPISTESGIFSSFLLFLGIPQLLPLVQGLRPLAPGWPALSPWRSCECRQRLSGHVPGIGFPVPLGFAKPKCDVLPKHFFWLERSRN